jgi:transposase
MARYKFLDHPGQGLILTLNLKEQLLPGTFEFTLNHLIDRTDLSAFDAAYHNDEKGAPAYPPSVLLKIIIYCYSRGIITSRPIEYACKTNMVVKALAQDAEPDHDTIAHFISSYAAAVKTLFSQVLLTCNELGLIGGDLFAVDGCKLPSNASKEWSGTIGELEQKKKNMEELAAKIVEQHNLLDKQKDEDERLNAACHSLVYDEEYYKRHIERIEEKRQYIDEFLKTAGPKMGAGGEVKSNITDNESGMIKGAHGYIQGYNGIAVADGANGVIITAEAYGSGSESEHFPEILDSLTERMRELSGEEAPLAKAIVEGDTGYFSEDNLQEAAKRKIEVLIPDPQFRKRDPHFAGQKGHGGKGRFTARSFTYNKKDNTYTCPNDKTLVYKGHVKLNRNSGDKYQAKSGDCKVCPLREDCIASRNGGMGKEPKRTLFIADKEHEENLSEKMREKIDDPAYRTLYGSRMRIIEPCFSDMTYCKGMGRFSLRSKIKVNIQWLLYCIVHNIGKCIPRIGEVYGV